MPGPHLERFLRACRSIVGGDHVTTDAPSLRLAGTATFPTSARPIAIVRPGSVDEIQRCVRAANDCRVPVYPVSRGRNWGYGSRVPNRDGCVLLDLGRLTHIRDHDEDLGYVTVEPGVTAAQLHAFLDERRSQLMAPRAGSGMGVSVLANLLERGFSTTASGPHENRAAQFCDLEVVLPSGELLRTGLGRFGDAAAARVDNWGIGPQLDGLFLQSNLGVVTAATLWLPTRAGVTYRFRGRLDDAGRLPELVDALRAVRAKWVPRATFMLLPRLRMLSLRRRYPWDATGGETPLSADLTRRLLPQYGDWTLSGYVYSATVAHAMVDVRVIKRVLGPKLDRLELVPVLPRGVQRWIGRLGRALGKADARASSSSYDDPADVTNMLYWRKKTGAQPGADPDRDRCGFVWWVPVFPFTGRDAARVLAVAQQTISTYGFEVNVALRFPTERTGILACTIAYDRDQPGDDERAMDCFRDLVRRGVEQGYYPYRLGVQGMDLLPAASHGMHADILRKLKQALDPNGILAPGRYEGSRSTPAP
jgi:4-cresol dehydrogenase (hydroxylating)